MKPTGLVLIVVAAVLAGAVATANSAPPDACPTDTWCFVPVPGTLAGDGSETGMDILYRSGTNPSGPLLIYLNGGGACWDADTCDCQPVDGFCGAYPQIFYQEHYDSSTVIPGYTLNGQSLADSWFGGANVGGTTEAMFAGPTSPYGTGWNFVHIPYTTGDVDSGDAVRTFTTTLRAQNITYKQYFKGYSNIRLYLQRIKRDFPNPSQVLLTGASAGGMADHCNLSQVVQTWPDAKISMFSEVGFPFSPPESPKIADVGLTWGDWHQADGKAVADTCPIEPSPGVSPWGFRNWIHYNSDHFPQVRQGFTDDYSDFAINGFVCEFQSTNTVTYCQSNSFDYTSLLTSTLLETLHNDIKADGPNPNFKAYYWPNICHSEIEDDGNSPSIDGLPTTCDYDNITEDGVNLNDWLRGFAQLPGYKWEDVK